MKIKVRTHHKDITSTLKEYAEKKLEKLTRFTSDIQDINVELDFVDSTSEKDRHVAIVTIKLPGTTVRAKETSKDMYASIDLIFEKLGTQLKKHKEKLKDHKKSSGQKDILSQPTRKKTKPSISSLKEEALFRPKPMGPEDAALIIDEESIPFLVFRNIENEKINVLYKTSENNFGLIEP
jgi:putative sigma-54 modulation protein